MAKQMSYDSYKASLNAKGVFAIMSRESFETERKREAEGYCTVYQAGVGCQLPNEAGKWYVHRFAPFCNGWPERAGPFDTEADAQDYADAFDPRNDV